MFEQSTTLCDVKYKIVMLGPSAVGKSAIIERFIQNRFDETKETVGIDFLVKNIFYQGKVFRLQLWDTAGQQKFKSLVPNYIRDAHCAVLVYDVTRKETFDGIDDWLKLFRQYCNQQAVSILVGNKTDVQGRQVSREEGVQKATKHMLSVCETSAKTGEGVEELFHSIIRNIEVGRPLGHEGSATSESINKEKVVKIDQNGKKFPCCYI